jgi:lactate dehydrogenase-like 2-hydroxyacid dehydrogenase
VFKYGGVRIGAGTANMASNSWREINGVQGAAPLMNTPIFNSRATAQAVFKAILNVLPDMAVEEMHALVMAGAFDTARDLIKFPTSKLEGKRLAIIGYGNIGREVAKIGAAFGMQVVIFARQKHKRWIESEGFEYASAIQDAAREADILSPHIGLGAYQCDTKNYANSHFINAEIFAVMRQGAVLINYDRGEIVDTQALASALETGRVRFAAIDADIFVDSNSEVTGPLARYRALAQKHPQKLQLLPHAAADTEHISRVEGAKQAVAQIMAVIESKKVTNLVGSLPIGYFDNGAKTVIGVGKVLAKDFKALSEKQIQEMQDNSLAMLNFWQNLSQAQDATSKALLIDLHAQTFLLKANTYTNMLRNNGLQGPYEQ